MSPTSDQAILQRWRTRRDPESFHQLVQRHAAMVYATCRRVLGNDTDAEDVTQDCFETLARHVPEEFPRRLGPWLHGMAARKSLMKIRSDSRRRQRESVYAKPTRKQPTPRPTTSTTVDVLNASNLLTDSRTLR